MTEATAWQNDSTRLKRSALRKELTLKPSTSASHSNIIIAFITSRKSPSVKMVAGRVKNTSTGLTKILRSPSTSATISASIKPLTVTPGIKKDIIITRMVVMSILSSVFMLLIFGVKIKKASENTDAFIVMLRFCINLKAVL